jgi:lipoprotein-anchoring transpeptidase ErfK/SrfK
VRAASAWIAALALAATYSAAGRAGPVGQTAPGSVDHAVIAHLVAAVEARATPGGRPVARLSALARWNGGPVGLLVLAERRAPDGGLWLRVRLPERPNGSTAWIPANVTELRSTPWRIVVSVGRRTVALERSGTTVRVFRAVVGAPGTPTPTGLFAVSERIRQPDPRAFYGPWVLLLTAYSDTLEHFDGGPGQISIHGRDGSSLRDPLGSARSHGCVRIPDSGIDLLARVAVEGTPVVIRA